jgi:16S rRNA (guanine966-N2)-methyltransferase
MRIIGGTYRGKKLLSPQDDQTRPTSDRVRENIFNILSHRFSFTNKRVLDLFSGTGALGIESLSRGASHATFVENHKPMVKILKENLAAFSTQTSLIQEDVLSTLNQKSATPFDVIFMDPPYGTVSFEDILEKILKNNWLSPLGIVVIEAEKKTILPEVSGFEIKETRMYGGTAVGFLKYKLSQSCLKSMLSAGW